MPDPPRCTSPTPLNSSHLPTKPNKSTKLTPPRPYRIPPSTRLRRAIHTNDVTLTARILKSHPSFLQNPDYNKITTTTLTHDHHNPQNPHPQYTYQYQPPLTTYNNPLTAGNSNTSLHLAASLGHLQIVNLLLSLGHEQQDDISLNEDFQTPLMLAAREGHTDVVHALCESGVAGVARQDRRGRDAVMLAAIGGHDTCLQILLTFAPPVSSSLPFSSSSSAASAMLPSNMDLTPVTALLSHTDIDGNTALHFASANGHLMVLRTLLAAGADAERKNIWSWTPVAYSATVAAEVYFRNLVAEVEKRRKVRKEVVDRGVGGGVRVVPSVVAVGGGGDGEEG